MKCLIKAAREDTTQIPVGWACRDQRRTLPCHLAHREPTNLARRPRRSGFGEGGAGFAAALALVQQNRPGPSLGWVRHAVHTAGAMPVLCLYFHDRR